MLHTKEQIQQHIKWCPNHLYELHKVNGREITFLDEYTDGSYRKQFFLNVTLYKAGTPVKKVEKLSRIIKIAKINYIKEL